MALTESAGAAYVTNATAVVSAASFTPTAGSLLVCIAGNGNANQVTGTGITIADTFSGSASGAWTALRAYAGTAGSGLAGVWVKDAGATPGAGVVTVTSAPSTAVNSCMIVRQFAGAAVAAQQTGAVAQVEGNLATISLTPTATGSQIVGAYGAGTNVTGVNNAATTGYGNTAGAGGSNEGCFEGNTLTTAGTAQVLGLTVAATPRAFVAAEILASAAASLIPLLVMARN